MLVDSSSVSGAQASSIIARIGASWPDRPEAVIMSFMCWVIFSLISCWCYGAGIVGEGASVGVEIAVGVWVGVSVVVGVGGTEVAVAGIGVFVGGRLVLVGVLLGSGVFVAVGCGVVLGTKGVFVLVAVPVAVSVFVGVKMRVSVIVGGSVSLGAGWVSVAVTGAAVVATIGDAVGRVSSQLTAAIPAQ